MNKLILMLSAMLLSFSAYSGVSEDMDSFFKSSGMQTNLSGPGAYQGQTAGLYTGGQLYARNQVKMIYPANIQLPAFSAGCGGIDAFTGAFSFISGKELVNSMESIASSAASYAFLLGMETFSPQMSGVQKHLSNIANAVNRANINSCEAASSLVGGMWPKTEVAQNHICTSAGSNGGLLSDWASAKQGCASGKMTSTLSGKAGEKYKDMIVINKNLAWETIKKNNYFGSQDTELKELMMSISGTVIIKNGGKDDSPNAITYKHSIVKDMSFIKALLYGGEAKIYKCDESDLCLNPTETNTKIAHDKSFTRMVSTILAEIKTHIENDTPLSQEQINFLNSTTLPLYKMFNVEYAMGKDVNILNIDSYAGLIATDLLYQYLNENLNVMTHASYSKDFQIEFMDKFRESIQIAREQLGAERVAANETINKTLNIVRQTQQLEQGLAGRLSSHLVNVIGYENGV